jgi:diacylglycerol O-acyltransferase / wax synthase
MQRMSGIDPMFLYSETPETPMEVAFTCVFDPQTAPGGYSFDAVRDHVARRLSEIPLLRRRLMTVPLGLDHPRWVDDPEFDLDNHLHRVGLPPHGGAEGLSDMTAEVMSHPLSPDQPPWEMHVVEGLDDGAVGVIAKMHHAVIDGVSGTRILGQLLDLTPEQREAASESPWQPEAPPSRTQLVTESLPALLTSPIRYARAAREIGKATVRMARHAATSGTGALTIPVGAPTPFPTPMRSNRSVSFVELDLGDVRDLKARAGVTMNDIVLALCSGALHHYLSDHHSNCADPLVAVVPVSVREMSERDAMGNRLSAMFVPLASDQEDPMERLLTVAQASKSAKAQERAVGYGDMAAAVADALPPALARSAFRLGARLGAVRRLRPGNLVVSNVPGPKFPLFFAGMRMIGAYPIGPVVDGVALNITVQSYLDSLFVGLHACPSVVPDIDALAQMVHEELEALTKAAGTGDRAWSTHDLGSLFDFEPVPSADGLVGRPLPVAFGVPCLG